MSRKNNEAYDTWVIEEGLSQCIDESDSNGDKGSPSGNMQPRFFEPKTASLPMTKRLPTFAKKNIGERFLRQGQLLNRLSSVRLEDLSPDTRNKNGGIYKTETKKLEAISPGSPTSPASGNAMCTSFQKQMTSREEIRKINESQQSAGEHSFVADKVVIHSPQG